MTRNVLDANEGHRAVVSCTALSLTLTAPVSMSVPQQAEEQRGRDEIQGSSAKEKTAKKKIAEDPQAQSFAPPARGFKELGKEFLIDQKQIWTSPAKIRFSDTQWLVPLSGITAGLFVTDSDFSGHLSKNPATISHYKTLSNAGVGALVGGAGGMWLLGHVRHNEHWSETGFLAGEAALNSLVAVETFKYSLRRQRPYQGDGSGPFFSKWRNFFSIGACGGSMVGGRRRRTRVSRTVDENRGLRSGVPGGLLTNSIAPTFPLRRFRWQHNGQSHRTKCLQPPSRSGPRW